MALIVWQPLFSKTYNEIHFTTRGVQPTPFLLKQRARSLSFKTDESKDVQPPTHLRSPILPHWPPLPPILESYHTAYTPSRYPDLPFIPIPLRLPLVPTLLLIPLRSRAHDHKPTPSPRPLCLPNQTPLYLPRPPRRGPTPPTPHFTFARLSHAPVPPSPRPPSHRLALTPSRPRPFQTSAPACLPQINTSAAGDDTTPPHLSKLLH